MKYLVVGLAIASGVLHARAPFSQEQKRALKDRIEALCHDVDPHLNIGIEVVSLKTGEQLYSKRATRKFTPASTLKLFAASSAFATLGSDYRFKTVLLSDGQQYK